MTVDLSPAKDPVDLELYDAVIALLAGSGGIIPPAGVGGARGRLTRSRSRCRLRRGRMPAKRCRFLAPRPRF